MIRYKVHMLAFGKPGEVRPVDVPGERAKDGPPLDDIFYYGQNEWQPRPHPSVSVGDVIEADGRYFVVRPLGFAELAPLEFAAYKAMDRLERGDSHYARPR